MRLVSAAIWPLVLPLAVYSSTVQPTAYHLQIDVSSLATSPTFNGSVGINLTTNTDTSEILLHAIDLNVFSVKVDKWSSFKRWVSEEISTITNNGSILQIIFPQPLPTSSYRLNIDFEGQYRDTMTGFAKVGFFYNKTQKFMGVTRFEPNYARFVFPCVDEPSPRVDFLLDITVSNQTVVSSVIPNIFNNTDTKKTYRFASYPKMAVYQLGWMVFDDNAFEVLEDNTSSTPVFTRALYPDSNYTSWATNVTARLLEATEKYTKLPFPLAKLEQLVVPEFFVGSAQSWGFISYSEEAFLVEASKPVTSTRVLHQVVLGLAQQVVQQWFGDFVSMDSWNNSWLMKGLAGHLKFSIASTIANLSSWELVDHEVVDLIQPALSIDNGLNAITPFSDLDLYRGSALIRMLQNFIGDELFQMAINLYLESKKGSDDNNPVDLWNILYEGAIENGVDLDKQSVQYIMKGWSDSAGYPILNVTSNGTHFNISQQAETGRFVPVTYLLQGSSSIVSRVWLRPGDNLTIPAGDSKWILLNVNQTGYFRINYDRSVLNGLIVDYSQLPRLSRSQLIDDMFSLTLSGDYSMVHLLQFISVLKTESDYFPWYSALKNMQDLIDKLYGHTSHDLLKTFILDHMSTVIAKIGMDKKYEDSHTDILRRVIIMEKACTYGHSKCLQKAVSILRSWMSGLYFDADLNMGLLCCAVSNSSDDIWRELLTMKIAAVPSIRPYVLKALTCSTNVQLLNEFLTNTTSKTNNILNSKDKNVFLQTLASTSFGADLLLNWLVDKLNSQIYIRTTTLIPYSPTTNGPTTTQKVTNVSNSPSVEDDNNFDSTEDSTSSSANSIVMNRLYKPIPSTSYTLADEDIIFILSLIRPKLNTIDQGMKLDKFVASKNNSGLSNSTLQLIEQITVQIYKQDEWARKYNMVIKSWLEATTTTPGVVTNPPVTTSWQTTTKSSRGTAATLYSSLTLTVFVISCHYLIPHLHIYLQN